MGHPGDGGRHRRNRRAEPAPTTNGAGAPAREAVPNGAMSGGRQASLERRSFTPVYKCWRNSPRVSKSLKKSHEADCVSERGQSPYVFLETSDRDWKSWLPAINRARETADAKVSRQVSLCCSLD
jgi:hypothetical protein